MQRKKIMLIIMDGVGTAPNSQGNAVTIAKPENLIKYWDTFPHTYLRAASEAVGLPANTNGNSEVGHLNIGAGKVIFQNLPRINKSIETGTFFSNTTLSTAFSHSQQFNSSIHLISCLSDGSVHAHISHLTSTIEYFSRRGFKGNLYIHAFTDGRDTPPKSAEKYLQIVQDTIDKFSLGKIATLCGRAFAMDRNETWDRVKKAYDLLVKGVGKLHSSWLEALTSAYNEGQTDEFIEPRIIVDSGNKPIISENDVVVFLNFRADRAVEITSAIIDPNFNKFETKRFTNLFFAGMVEYQKGFPKNVLFPKEYVNLSLGRILSDLGKRQLRISESEKFPHVTYFFNGGLAIKHPGEDRIEIDSPHVATYDLKPEMSAYEILDVLSARISLDIYDFIVLNLANGDMVGHTGNLEASIKAVKIVDFCVDKLVKDFTSLGGTVIISADHGNVEELINLKSGQVDTEHSINPVPLIIIDPSIKLPSLPFGALCDIAPTILSLMGIPKPSEMNGKSLI